MRIQLTIMMNVVAVVIGGPALVTSWGNRRQSHTECLPDIQSVSFFFLWSPSQRQDVGNGSKAMGLDCNPEQTCMCWSRFEGFIASFCAYYTEYAFCLGTYRAVLLSHHLAFSHWWGNSQNNGALWMGNAEIEATNWVDSQTCYAKNHLKILKCHNHNQH